MQSSTPNPKQSQKLELGLDLTQELENSVIPEVEHHWDLKNNEGIIPAEIKKRGNFNKEVHDEESAKLAEFELKVTAKLCATEWKKKPGDRGTKVHYFGVGTGEALKRVTPVLNHAGYEIVAYDTSKVACANAARVFEEFGSLPNKIFHADICYACDERFITREIGCKIIIPRVLNVLDTQGADWKGTERRFRKMERTLWRLGPLMSYAELLIIHPCARDNQNVIWGDTTPHTFEEIKECLERTLNARIDLVKLGSMTFHGHVVYTAATLKKKTP